VVALEAHALSAKAAITTPIAFRVVEDVFFIS
jgi:hypothetical protein